MNEKELALKLIKENEYYMCNFVDHVAISLPQELLEDFNNCNYELLQQIMNEHYYKITKKTDNRKKKNKTFYLIHRTTINV